MNYDDELEESGSGKVTLVPIDSLKRMSPERRKQSINTLLKRIAKDFQDLKIVESDKDNKSQE